MLKLDTDTALKRSLHRLIAIMVVYIGSGAVFYGYDGWNSSWGVREWVLLLLFGIMFWLLSLLSGIFVALFLHWLNQARAKAKCAATILLMVPAAVGIWEYLRERTYAWNFRPEYLQWVELVTTALWPFCVMGVVAAGVVGLFVPDISGFIPNAGLAKLLRRYLTALISFMLVCLIAWAFLPDSDGCLEYWGRVVGAKSKWYPPQGYYSFPAAAKKLQILLIVFGPTLALSGIFLALYWTSLPLEHAIIKREHRRIEKNRKRASLKCPACSYSLVGLPNSARCPECGFER